jgi:predicted amidophosphoribosyltransferase
LPLVCKGICQRFRNIGGGRNSVYELGFKRCSECGIYIKFAGPKCPCCKLPLRSKKRNGVKIDRSDSKTVVAQAKRELNYKLVQNHHSENDI